MTTILARALIACLLAASLAASARADNRGRDHDPLVVSRGTVITNAIIVDTRTGALRRGVAVVIDGGRIERIVEARSVRVVGAARRVDAEGRYLVPGYNDMHTHALQAVDATPTYWPLFIANGVTGIREAGGSAALIQRARQLNAESAIGAVAAPEVLTIPGDIVAGQVITPQATVDLVNAQKAAGAGFIKVTVLPPPFLAALIGTAHAQGLKVAGHLLTALPSTAYAAAGWDAFEHLGAGPSLVLDCATDDAAIRADFVAGRGAPLPPPAELPLFIISPNSYRALDAPLHQRILDSYSDDKCRGVTQTIAKFGVWQTPTLIRLHTIFFNAASRFRNDPNLIYVDKTRRALWESLAQKYLADVPASGQSSFENYFPLFGKAVGLLRQADASRILAGSDTGGIWVIPGFSLHQEFRELAAAGLTPLEVLQATTLNAARFLGREATLGAIDEGKDANLVLLDRNPLERVEHLARIAGVFLKGRYFPRRTLEKMKAEVATAYGNQPANHWSTVVDPNHRH